MDSSDQAGGAGGEAQAEVDEIERQTNKRLTLNLLIQGAAAHTFLTSHHLVRDELEAIRPGLTALYDKLVISLHLNYWIGDIVLIYGFPWRFWRRTRRPSHPFHRHRLLATHGRELSRASKRYVTTRGWAKGVIGIPILHYVQFMVLLMRTLWAERRHKFELAQLAKRATNLIWGIDEDRLIAAVTRDMSMQNVRQPKTFVGKLTRMAAVGWGGVQHRGGQLKVVAKSITWPLLSHELTKGVAELICLHGLNTLDDTCYAQVMDEADHIEYETWMLQAGGEAWRRLLAALPHDRPMPEMLMHIARLKPDDLERLMLAVISDPARARSELAALGEIDDGD
jgi:hypothetical protein